MANGTVNKITIMGYVQLPKDDNSIQQQNIELLTDTHGNHYTKFCVVTDEGYHDKQKEQWIEKTERHNMVVFRRTAEVAAQYLRHGSLAYFEGRNQTTKYQDTSTGQDRYSTQIVVLSLTMLGNKSENLQAQAPAKSEEPFGAAPVRKEPQDVEPREIKPANVAVPASGESFDNDRDPF